MTYRMPVPVTPTLESEITYSEPEVLDGYGALQSPAPEYVQEKMRVQVLRSPDSPLMTFDTPNEEELFKRLAPTANYPTAHAVTEQAGTVERPIVERVLGEEFLFLDGGPSKDDIRQGVIQDCYFLSVLSSIAEKDPSHIKNIVRIQGNLVTVKFYYLDAASETWLSTVMPVGTLLSEEGNLIGASFNVEHEASGWSADISDQLLSVERTDIYRSAQWVAYIEKAYEIFAASYGKYGGVIPEQGESDLSDNHSIEWGFSEYVYAVLYGNRAHNETESIRYTPGADFLSLNAAAVKKLLALDGDPILDDGQKMLISSRITLPHAISRLSKQIEYILQQPPRGGYDSLHSNLSNLQSVIEQRQAIPEGKEFNIQRNIQEDRIIDRAATLCRKGNWPILHQDSAPEEYKILNEFALVVGQEKVGGEQQMIRANHSYAVHSVNWMDKAGQPLDLSVENYLEQLSYIDGDLSKVKIQDPYHQNEMNLHGKGIVDGENDGLFSISLSQYLRNFSKQEGALIS